MPSQTEDFRAVFRHHPAGVVLVTATVDDRPVGLVLSSLASLAVDPLAVSYSLSKKTGRPGALLRASTCLVHFLSGEQADIAREFASPHGRHFTADQGWATAPTGEPLLTDAPAVFRVRPAGTVEVGPATLVAAEVLDVRASPAVLSGDLPHLLYVDRTFCSRPRATGAADEPAPGDTDRPGLNPA
ncbi:4-nitrophenol 4-monooxygenase/4-nitrocatechol 2-monooxygenase, reductase component [Corynebacterium provencense]|uniref:4-nitrophenol 4-monooxygenase/4-nitrocatechol 2-monooxygenase, reductase component n=1 Tax=Corynebacterium provencense TaxID=1737425 RepID=A0A2Z3YPZ6_9CORY|nr:flavin reductase family protein [Corynebacterium provencense]AWT26736.1 4-nitrophenol 4-monooxygenase/4-nitrocatechol 2-monooxygenase, reductase component [Corynebacterium provencense]